jgi:CheY-like chemotaxis protein
VIHGIVTECHGDIQVKSAPGKGTTFELFFPCLPSQKHIERTDAEFDAIPGGQERILLVDDEGSIVLMAKRMLERLGYTVTTRTSSLEALELFKTVPGRFDLVITDLTMPDMTGDRLANELRTIRPDIPLILFTGFSNRMDEERAAELGIDAFVLKPLLKGDLARAIRKALDDNSGKERIN